MPHGAPKMLMLRSTRSSGIPARVSGSDTGNVASPTILGLQPENEAEYYHSTWDDSINNDNMLQAHGDLRHNLPLFLRAMPMNACDKTQGDPGDPGGSECLTV